MLEVSVVTYGLWDGHNSNSMTLCDTWVCVLVATCGVYVLQLFRCCFGAEVLPPKRGVAIPSLAWSVSGRPHSLSEQGPVASRKQA